MLQTWLTSRRRPKAIEQPVAAETAPTRDQETERAGSAEILAQAQWLYEQHERRVQNCQNMAIAILTIVGTIMALAPSVLPASATPWELVALGFVTVSGLITILQCVRVLIPRTRTNGLPGVDALRCLAHQHEEFHARLTDKPIPVPVTQFATDLLNPMNLTDPSPLTQAAKDAEVRTALLAHVYGWFAVTFALAVSMTTLFALTS